MSNSGVVHGRAGEQGATGSSLAKILACRKIFFLLKTFRRKRIDRKGILAFEFRQHGWTELRKVVSELILK